MLGRVALGAVIGSLGYLASGHYRRYGATHAEQALTLPGDDLVPSPAIASTRAITIQAPPERVWPWIVQIGQDKAGFYSYAWLENLVGCDMSNADEINPDWQNLQVGDDVRLHPEAVLQAKVVEPDRALVIAPQSGPAPWPAMDFDFSWAFVVVPDSDGYSTRLLVRERYHPYGVMARASVEVGQLVSALMSFGMLRGIRDRAIRQAIHSASVVG